MLAIPTVTFVSQTTVTISVTPPSHSYYNYVITYVVKYHKEGDPVWQTQSPVTCVTQTVTGLMKATVYEFKVATKYEGGRWGPDSRITSVRTGKFELGVLKSCIDPDKDLVC